MVEFAGDVERYKLTISLMFLIACICFLVGVYVTGVETEVMRDRFWKNAEPLFNREVPVTEYPPFALVFFVIPRFFGDTPWTYNIAYVAEVLVFMVVGLLLVSRLAKRLGHNPRRAMVVYGILILVMIQLVADRYDIFPTVLMLASFYLFVTKRYFWAGVVLAIAAMTKLYPAVVFPLYLIYLLHERNWRGTFGAFCGFLIAEMTIVAVCWLIEPQLITNFLSYHTNRPLQIESFPASLLYLFSIFGLIDVWMQPATAEGSYGSDNLMGAVPDIVASAMMPIMIALTLLAYATYLATARRTVREGSLRLLELSVILVLMIFMVMNKVFSSQYLIWIIPPVAFVLCLYERGGFGRRLWASMVLMLVLTQLNFAYNVGYCSGEIGDLGMLIVLARNIVAMYVIAIILMEMCRPSEVDGQPPAYKSEEPPMERKVIISRHAR